jgi:hypothetical protein
VENEELTVLFPDAEDKNNFIEPNTAFHIPREGKGHSIVLAPLAGEVSTDGLLIAIVTTEAMPFPNLEKPEYKGNTLLTYQTTLHTYARWLYGIDVAHRASAMKQVQVRKK